MLVRNLGITGKHKLQYRWNPLPYLVIEKLPHLPVYRVKPERGFGVMKTLHRNHLLPIGYLVRMPVNVPKSPKSRRPITRARGVERLRAQSGDYEEQDEWNFESEEEDLYPLPQLTFQRTGLWDKPVESDNTLPAPSDTPVVPVEGPTVSDVSEEEDEQEELIQCGGTEDPLSPVLEPVVDTELDGGDVLASSVLDKEVESISEPK